MRRVGIASFITLTSVVSLASGVGCASFATGDKPKTPPRLAAQPETDEREAVDVASAFQATPEDAVVRVVTGQIACSGTLIAPDLVLTAHHCVAMRTELGDFLPEDVPASEIRVELGGDFLAWGEVTVRDVVAPNCGHAAGPGDIAILILARSVSDVPVRRPRLDDAPNAGEKVRPVGFGHCALSSGGIRRQLRLGGTISEVGGLRFQSKAAICPGDSGGPVFDQAGAIVGVISVSAMDANAKTRERTEYTRLDKWREVFAYAQQLSRGGNRSELPPLEGCPE